MLPDQRADLIRQCIVVTVGTLMFLLFMLLCYAGEFGPADRARESVSMAFPGFLIGLGAITTLIGVVDAGGHPPGERGFGYALAAEGALLVLLTLIAWGLMRPAPPYNPLPF